MKELCIIIDVSGSMSTLGKVSIVGNILQTLSVLKEESSFSDGITLSIKQLDGNSQSLETIIENCFENQILLLTDGYSLVDNCLKNRQIKEFIEGKKDDCFVVLCGGDALNISSYKEFVRANTVTADNILYAIDVLLNNIGGKFSDEKKQDGEDWE